MVNEDMIFEEPATLVQRRYFSSREILSFTDIILYILTGMSRICTRHKCISGSIKHCARLYNGQQTHKIYLLEQLPKHPTPRAASKHLVHTEPLRQEHRRNQRPQVDGVAHPRTDDLHPAGPIGATNGRKVVHRVGVQILSQERGYPGGRQEEDHVEQRVVVLGGTTLIVFGVIFIIRFIVAVIEGTGGETTASHGSTECFGTHLTPTGRLLSHKTMFIVLTAQLRIAVPTLGSQSNSLSGRTRGGIRNGRHGDNRTQDNTGGSGAAGPNQRVALFVVRFHRDSRHSQVGAIRGHHGSLGQARSGV